MREFARFIGSLQVRFQRPLPGREAQLKMASIKRLQEGLPLEPPPNARHASVLILIYPRQGIPHIAFIRRIEYDGVHSGQIAFPGGEKEPDDRSAIDTALREAWEETGVNPAKVTLLGNLTEMYIPPSNFLVTPIVGYSLERPTFRADPAEVQEILELPLSRLSDGSIIMDSRIDLGKGYSVSAPSYTIDGIIIWGATAMMLSEFLEMLQ